MSKVSFHYVDIKFAFNKKTILKSFIEELYVAEQRYLVSTTYIFCSDEYLLKINQQFLQHDFFTDIITFELSDNPQQTMGEVYISVERVKDNARKLNIPLIDELLRVCFHGALHLCGYKDKTKADLTLMRNKEDHYLRLFKKNNV